MSDWVVSIEMPPANWAPCCLTCIIFPKKAIVFFSVAEWTGKLQCSHENIDISRSQYEFGTTTLIDISCWDAVSIATMHSNWNMNSSKLGSSYFSKVMTLPFLRKITCLNLSV